MTTGAKCVEKVFSPNQTKSLFFRFAVGQMTPLFETTTNERFHNGERIRAVVPGMQARKFGRIVNITSAMVKSPGPEMGLSTAARTGLTALAKSVSRTCAPDNVTINNLLPYRIDTDRQRFFARRMMQQKGITMEEARAEIGRGVAAGRMGRPEEFADACAFLCSAQAGFISGQNLQIDGGSYAGVI